LNGIALQLYTLRTLAAADLEGTLQEVGRIGYRSIELAGLHGESPERVRSWLDAAGIEAMGAHVPWERFAEDPDGALAELRTLGCGYAIVPSLPAGLHGLEAVPEAARAFGEWAERCEAAGIRFGYHNHDYELRVRDERGKPLLERLIAATDERVVFELDVLWATVGGADPRDLLERYEARFRILHVKDRAGSDADAPFGEGSLPWDDLLPAARTAGVEWYVVEQDVPRDPLRDVETSLRNLNNALGTLSDR
jgi:sugar phosphate isomerase/epimerase